MARPGDEHEPQRQWSGLKTMVIAGRGVTYHLQKLRTSEKTFEEWYGPIQDAMKPTR